MRSAEEVNGRPHKEETRGCHTARLHGRTVGSYSPLVDLFASFFNSKDVS
jgi:hypothetical protein